MIRQLFKRLNAKESCLNFKNIDISKPDSCSYARSTLYLSYKSQPNSYILATDQPSADHCYAYSLWK